MTFMTFLIPVFVFSAFIGLGVYLLDDKMDAAKFAIVSSAIFMVMIFAILYDEYHADKACPVCGESYSNTEYEYCPVDGAELEVCEK